MIKRFYELNNFIRNQKVLIIYGTRRSGKTTLLKHFLSGTELKTSAKVGQTLHRQTIEESV